MLPLLKKISLLKIVNRIKKIPQNVFDKSAIIALVLRSVRVSCELKESIVFYDEVCGFCSASVKWLMRFDRDNRLHFEPLSDEVYDHFDIDPAIDSIVFVHKGVVYYKSTAVIRIFQQLGGLWRAGVVFLLIPRLVRDFIYDLVAKYRYKIMGQKSSCGITHNLFC